MVLPMVYNRPLICSTHVLTTKNQFLQIKSRELRNNRPYYKGCAGEPFYLPRKSFVGLQTGSSSSSDWQSLPCDVLFSVKLRHIGI